MPDAHDIAYVCLSDLHLGEEDSLLTALRPGEYLCDPARPGPVLEQLAAALRDLIGRNQGPSRPTLILNGDVLELAFGSLGHALMSFERLLELVISPGRELFDRVIYLPGNHDHHIWELARESMYVQTVLAAHRDDELPPVHTTPLSPDACVGSYVLDQVARHVRGCPKGEPLDFPILVSYPNLAVHDPERDRAVVFHHGHFVESLYCLITHVRNWLFPERTRELTVEQLEGENFAWIDFVWSLLGRSGAAGADVETLFKRLQYPPQVKTFIAELASRIPSSANLPFVPGEWLERRTLHSVFERIVTAVGGDRRRDELPPSEAISRGVIDYMSGPLARQLTNELGHMPRELSFVFGHTHKPYDQDVKLADGPMVQVYNTGGWTLDSITPTANRGASLVLVSRSLDPLTLHLYSTTERAGTFVPHVHQTQGASAPARAFRASVERHIDDGAASVWTDFTQQVGQAVDERREHMRRKFAS